MYSKEPAKLHKYNRTIIIKIKTLSKPWRKKQREEKSYRKIWVKVHIALALPPNQIKMSTR